MRQVHLRTTSAAVLLVAVSVLVPGALASRVVAAERISKEQAIQLQRTWLDLLVAAKWKQAADMMTSDFLWIHPTGRVDTRESRLEPLMKGPQPAWTSIETKDIQAAVYPDSAVVTSEVNWASALAAGETAPRVLHLRLTTAWVNQEGTWRVVRMQVTTIPPPTNQTPSGGR